MRRSMLPVSLFLVFLGFLPVPAAARIISYAPYTSLSTFPAVQHRMNRYFVVVENDRRLPSQPGAQLVLYDSTGIDEPRVIRPATASSYFTIAAVREDARQISTILIYDGKWKLSADSGATWKEVAMQQPNTSELLTQFADRGGPFARECESQVRIGTEESPFLVTVFDPATSGTSVVVVDRNGTARKITNGRVVGTNRTGSLALIDRLGSLSVHAIDGSFHGLDMTIGPMRNGWITDDGDVYAIPSITAGDVYFMPRSGLSTRLSASFAIPTFDYSGAWIVQLGTSTSPARLYRHTAGSGALVKQWEDVTNPQIEALHAGASGNTLLIQVHRPRPVIEQAPRIDPALAIWRIGEPAPHGYDELYLSETTRKGFVHLDVDAVANGAPFVFDSGVIVPGSGGGGGFSGGGGGGGADIVQEWGLIRGSLRQTLVLPGVARAPGAFGTFWVTDVTLRNDNETTNRVRIRYVPTGTSEAEEKELTLAAREIRQVSDVLQSIFAKETGAGVFYINADEPLDVTSRTYTRSAEGTYGYGMPAFDTYAAATSRFPVTFSGAFPGTNFRTNLIVADAGETGSSSTLGSISVASESVTNAFAYATPRGGQTQINNIGSPLGIASGDAGALAIAPEHGSTIASIFAIDNITNDPTWFSPDVVATVSRSIPAVGHLDGANNSKFRSDLYLYNPSNNVASILIEAHAWDAQRSPYGVWLTLLPREARVIRDVLYRMFGWTGFARLRLLSAGIRFNARTYTTDANGGTYGSLMPPLNAFQVATSGESLEILGATIDSRSRTNIGIVELSGTPGSATRTARVEILGSGGIVLDNFTITPPSDGGLQINDVFRARNITGDGTPVLIRITPMTGIIGAYATSNDNGTNDSILLSAQLAAQD